MQVLGDNGGMKKLSRFARIVTDGKFGKRPVRALPLTVDFNLAPETKKLVECDKPRKTGEPSTAVKR